MTYTKPEQLSEASSNNQDILNLATKKAQEQNWSVVLQQLKLLPQTRRRAKKWQLNSQEWQTTFEIALSMLLEADFQHKWEITKLFPSLGSGIAPTLTNIVLDETVGGEVRWFICQILGNFPQQEVVLTLVELLQQTDEGELIKIAGKTLTKIGDHAVAPLVDLLEQPQHRFLAVQSLSYIRTAKTIAPLLSVASDQDSQIRATAIKALGSFHDRRVPPVLIQALTDKASAVRKEAAIALGFRPELCQELDLVGHLQPLLRDLNIEVCSEAAIALGRMKQEPATAALSQILQASTTPMQLKSEIARALGWSEVSSGISYLQQALSQASAVITQEIIVVLGRVRLPELRHQSTQVLINFWQEQQPSHPQIRQTLANSLGELGNSSARGILEQLAADGDRKVQLHAQAALRKLA
ncbi:MAG: HEAT repeat domain-containing protein [Cyanobacteria bacterium J06621_8]